MDIYPFLLQPVLKEKLWGGNRLVTQLGKNASPDIPIGESWEISDRSDGSSRISNGPLSGKTLQECIRMYPSEILGPTLARTGQYLPLLYKYIDATADLSVQVHPDAAYCNRNPGLYIEPKNECWYILDAPKNAALIVGLQPGVTKNEIQQSIAAGTLLDHLYRLPIQKDDMISIPAGMVHAITAGTLLCEIQQNSDTTFRIFDYNRTDKNGSPRELHIDQALQAIQYNEGVPAVEAYTETQTEYGSHALLLHTPHFEIHKHTILHSWRWEKSADLFTGINCIAGTGTIATVHGSISIKKGRSLLIPASVQFLDITPGDKLSVLFSRPCI